jgi:glycosyltransferase involved in cell wall biosynthesis
MRVLFVIDGLGTGGAERSLAEITPLLRARGFDLATVYFHERSPGVGNTLRQQQVKVRRVDGRLWVTRCLRLRREIRRFDPALIHATLVGPTLIARFAAARTRVPVLTSLVNTTYTPPARLGRRGLRRTVIRAIDSWTARHLNTGFHAISQAVAADAATNLAIEQKLITVIPRGRTRDRLGWPSSDRSQRIRGELDIPEDVELLLSVGRQEVQKGHATLIDAWARIASARPSAHLVLAGRSGRASAAVCRAIDNLPVAARQRVQMVGHLDEIGDLLSAADVFLFPSLHEGLGGALIEALAMGLPIIASDLPVFREFLVPGENAILVPPRCPDALAGAAVRLLADESLRTRMATANLDLFEHRFQMDLVAEQTELLYRKLARTRSRVS